MISSPTRASKTLLDHIYVTKKQYYINCGNFNFCDSDHDLVFVVRKANNIKYEPKTISTRNYKTCNWEALGKQLNTLLFNFSQISSADEIYTQFNSATLAVIDEHIPIKKRIVKGKPRPWFTSELNELKKRKHKAMRTYQQSKLDSDLKLYRSGRNEYNNALKRAKFLLL